MKILVLMPFFMGYNNCIEEYLKKEHDVTVLNNEIFLPDINAKYNQIRGRRYLQRIPGWYPLVREKLQKSCAVSFNQYVNGKWDLILNINGHYLPDSFYRRLREANPQARMILYLWDDVSNIKKYSHFKLFDLGFSFNKQDCEKLGFSYLPMFVQQENSAVVEKVYDIAIIGTAHPDRLNFVKRFYEKYNQIYNIFVYMVQNPIVDDFFCHKEALDYQQYLEILAKSKAVMDIPFFKQTGPTTRFMDAAVSRTKVITTNPQIKLYEFFNDNVCIVERDNPIVEDGFVEAPYSNDASFEIMTVGRWFQGLTER